MTTDPFGAYCPHFGVNIPGRAAGPLANLTFAAKDNFAIAGYRCAAGNPDWLRTHASATRTAPAVQRLLNAGASLVAKTNMDELAFSLDGVNFHYGTPTNPRAPDRIPGGSSSGSAAATAGALVDFALGTDTVGSVRVPASLCGLFGIRPTHGRIPIDDIVPFAPSFDTVGWMTRTAELLGRVGEVLLGPPEESLASPRRLLIADDVFADADEPVRNALTPLLHTVGRAIGKVQHVANSVAGFEAWIAAFGTLRGAEVCASLGEWISTVQPNFGPGIRDRFEQTRSITPEMVELAKAARQKACEHLDVLLGDDAVLCLPTVPVLAPLRTATQEELATYRARTLRTTIAATITGLPQVTLPLAETGRPPSACPPRPTRQRSHAPAPRRIHRGQRKAFRAPASCNHAGDRLPSMRHGQRAVGAVGQHQMRVDAKQDVDRRHQIGGRNRVILWIGGHLVGGAEDAAGFDAAAGEQAEAALRPVVAARRAVDLGAAAHLSHHHHQRRIEQPTLIQVLNQRRVRRVEDWQVGILQHAEVIFVHVVGVAHGAEDLGVDADKRHAPLDEATRGEQARAGNGGAVALAHAVRSRSQIEGLARLARRQQGIRALLELVGAVDGAWASAALNGDRAAPPASGARSAGRRSWSHRPSATGPEDRR